MNPNKENTEEVTSQDTPAEETCTEETVTEQATVETPEAAADSTAQAELDAAKAALADKDKQYQYLAAEYDNFRRRSKEERDAMYADAVGESVRELLPIIDNLKRASQYTDSEKLSEGVAMILKSVPAALEKLGVEEFGKVGEKFDPNLHNAVLHEESAEFGESEIMDVLQTGYRRGDKILRFAMVKVAN